MLLVGEKRKWPFELTGIKYLVIELNHLLGAERGRADAAASESLLNNRDALFELGAVLFKGGAFVLQGGCFFIFSANE